MADETFYLGIDIGGTKVAAGLVTAAGRIVTRARVAMEAAGTASAALDAVVEAAETAAGGRRVAGIGVSSPGPLDPRRGVVVNPPNLPCWRKYPLARNLARALAVDHRGAAPTPGLRGPRAGASRSGSRGVATLGTAPLNVRLDNDANAAALAEARWGAGRRYACVFYATLGTGIGAGLVLDGKVYHGRTGNAVEAGHLSIDRRGPRCGCGKRGCIEALASGPAVARRAKMKTAEAVAEAWRQGDPQATAVLQETAELLGIWLGNIVDVLEPEVIIFGGGMGALMAEWFPQIQATIPQWSINPRAGEIPLRRARYGNEAGIAGGAALCL